jgi:hypothetical protein
MSFLGISINSLPLNQISWGFPWVESFIIIFWISSGVKNLIGCIIRSGSSSALLISASKASFCGSSFGLNAFSKCLAKVFAFSSSFRAQVWSALLIGGMRCVCCFNRLVAFQNE